ncbi:MAG: SUF system Fe-S cluster assembly protein [Planctomycetota bacterium]|nr:SUF system Fe-S cluster assembly protein [Planctomycetota bacterium]
MTLAEAKQSKEAVIRELQTIYDPEIPVNIYELGMIYNVSVGLKGDVHVKMTLTSPACPVAGTLPGEVEQKLRALSGVTQARVELVWDPPWNKSMMSEAAKLELNVM